jgi:RNA polymerase sigma factor (sigma-70 family)
MQELDDIALLRQYTDQKSEEAFATLVSRHVNKVYSVALRHTRNPHQAEEITQAVFVILAKKSGQLGKKVVLSGWLYETSRLTAVTFIRSEIRRGLREQEAHMQNSLNDIESDVWSQISPLLDAGLAALSGTDRHAVVLRFFDGKNMKEVGIALGASEDAAKMRLNRAVEKLRRFFTKRGVVFPAAVLTAAISENSVQAAPVGLAVTITATVAKGAVVGSSTFALVKGAMDFMAWTKAKMAIVTSLIILAAAGTATEQLAKLLRTNPAAARTTTAAEYLLKLTKEGQLPGFPEGKEYVIRQKGDPGLIQIQIPGLFKDSNGIWHFKGTNMDIYPLSVTLKASKSNDGYFVYFYTVVKASETNDWQLQKAWLNDTNGQVVKEFTVR